MGELAGIAAALVIAEKWGGTRLYFPKDLGPEHPISQAIGHEKAVILCREYFGERPEIPRATGWLTAARDRVLLEQRKTMSQPQLARAHGMTERGIREALRRARSKPEVPDISPSQQSSSAPTHPKEP